MSTVVFKLRVINPRSRGAPGRNKSHMEYIGRRKGVCLNEDVKHGLFGVINGDRAEEVANIQELSRYVENMTRNGTIMYRAVISLEEADAVRLGYDEPEKWRELVRQQLPQICDKIGISISNLEYSAAVHLDKGHPHCHLLFWDKKQDVKKKAFVEPKLANRIRAGFIKHVFADEMAELQNIKSEARSATLTGADNFFGDFVDAFAEMTPKQYRDAVERLKCEGELADGRLIYSRFKTANMREFASDLMKLRDNIPRTGRLNMKFMPPDTKSEIHDFIREILTKNADCGREFQKYINAVVDLSKYYSDKPELHDKARQNAEDDIMNRLGNIVLRTLKKLNSQEVEKDYEARSEAYRRQTIENLVTEFFGILSRSSQSEENKLSYAMRHGELSKQAKKELALELENSSGYDWER